MIEGDLGKDRQLGKRRGVGEGNDGTGRLEQLKKRLNRLQNRFCSFFFCLFPLNDS